MKNLLQSSFSTKFAVTIAFGLGTTVIVAAMFLLSELAGQQVVLTQNVTNWYQLGLVIAGFAAFSGLFVDGFRYLADELWK